MNILRKHKDFTPFDWLDFRPLSNSKASRFQIYFPGEDEEYSIDSSIDRMIWLFQRLFHNYSNSIVVTSFLPEGEWGSYCLETFEIDDLGFGTTNYSREWKNQDVKEYMLLLRENNILPTYVGACYCEDWDKFLRITLNCVMTHVAPYGFMFYSLQYEFVFYFHHTESVGLYYKTLNDAIIEILKTCQENNLGILWLRLE